MHSCIPQMLVTVQGMSVDLKNLEEYWYMCCMKLPYRQDPYIVFDGETHLCNDTIYGRLTDSPQLW